MYIFALLSYINQTQQISKHSIERNKGVRADFVLDLLTFPLDLRNTKSNLIQHCHINKMGAKTVRSNHPAVSFTLKIKFPAKTRFFKNCHLLPFAKLWQKRGNPRIFEKVGGETNIGGSCHLEFSKLPS